MRSLSAALVGVLALVVLASPGCTAVYSDFEECSLEQPRVFDTPPCGPDYVACVNGCSGDEDCEEQCVDERPECDQCFTDTYRICSDESFGCDATFTELVCCIEGLCGIANPGCEECADLSAQLNDCWGRAAPTCQPRLGDCVEGF